MSNLATTLRKYQVPLIGGVLALIGFFLSWITVPLGSGLGVSTGMSAFSLATLGRSEMLTDFVPESRLILLLWLFLAIPVICLIMGVMALRNPENERTAYLIFFIGGLVGLLLLLAPVIYLWVAEPEAFATAGALIDPGLGLWLTIIGLLVMLVSGILLYQQARHSVGNYQDDQLYYPSQPAAQPLGYTAQEPQPSTESADAVGFGAVNVSRPTDFTSMPSVGGAAPSRSTEVLNLKPDTLAWLVMREGSRAGHTFRVSSSTSIGRDADNDIIIDDNSMSGQHAKVKLEDGGHFILYDLASTNGVFVYDAGKSDWERVYRHELTDGQQVKFGRTVLSFMHLSEDVAGEKA